LPKPFGKIDGARPSRLCGQQASRLLLLLCSAWAGETPTRHTAETAVLRQSPAPDFSTLIAVTFTVETEQETDGRWIAEIAQIPGRHAR
jgi:hypothetical protein